MECPKCGNTIGFGFGTCVECGYNYLDNTYRYIKVDTEILKQLVPLHVFKFLVKEHDKRFKNR